MRAGNHHRRLARDKVGGSAAAKPIKQHNRIIAGLGRCAVYFLLQQCPQLVGPRMQTGIQRCCINT